MLSPLQVRAFQSTLSLRRATDLRRPVCQPGQISIHALLAESDLPPRCSSCMMVVFQSTLSLRRATGGVFRVKRIYIDFNPRSPCGERLLHWMRMMSEPSHFNPRSPCGERHLCGNVHLHFTGFQSTLSLRRATHRRFPPASGRTISIHALLAESDSSSCSRGKCRGHFNPRSPCGERRPPGSAGRGSGPHFNPRSPCGERPRAAEAFVDELLHFNPRSPCGERLGPDGRIGQYVLISIHALLAESDYITNFPQVNRKIFQSTLSLRRATANTTKLALSFLSKVPI